MRRASWKSSRSVSLSIRLGCSVLACFWMWGACGREPDHPSLLFDAGDIARLRQDIKTGWMKQAFHVMKERAGTFLDVPVDPYPLHGRTNGAATTGRALNNRVSTLALTGMLTGDTRYCEHAVDMLMSAVRQTNVADYERFNEHLAVGDGAHAYAMAYDWLWGTMTEEERALVREEIRSFGTWLYEWSMRGRGYGAFIPQNLSCNHNAVHHGGLGLCSLALSENPEWCERATTFVRGYLDHARDETGYNYEGVGYYAYGSWGAVPFGVALKRAGKGDIFRDIDTLPLIPNYILRQVLPWGREVVSMNDSPARLGSSGGFMYLLSRFHDRAGLWAWLRLYGPEGDGLFGTNRRGYLGDAASIPYTLLLADPSLEPLSPADAGLPLHAFFEGGRASFRSGWGDLDALATFTCGFDQHRGHNHRDENSFTFFARGETFALDPGYDPKETRCHNTVLVDGIGQDSDDGEYDVHGKTETVREFDGAWSITGNAVEAFPERAQVSEARRQFLFVNSEIPYLVIADELDTHADRDAEYTWLLHTAKTNTIRVGERPDTAFIEGARRGAVCMVHFICPQEGLQISETDLTGQSFERKGRSLPYSRYFKELRAVHRADRARFIAVLTAADTMEDLPRIRWEGIPDDMRLQVQPSAKRTDSIHITPQSILFETR